MFRTRSYRRHQSARTKAKTRRILSIWFHDIEFMRHWIDDPEVVGRLASVHCKGCSCTGCGNPRRHFGELTYQEQKANLTYEEELLSVDS